MSDVFGKRGREWLADQELVAEERDMVEACLRHLDLLGRETALLDAAIAPRGPAPGPMLRLLQLPGVSATTAATLMAAHRRHLALPDRAPPGRLSRANPARSPVRLRAPPATSGSANTA